MGNDQFVLLASCERGQGLFRDCFSILLSMQGHFADHLHGAARSSNHKLVVCCGYTFSQGYDAFEDFQAWIGECHLKCYRLKHLAEFYWQSPGAHVWITRYVEVQLHGHDECDMPAH